MAKEIVKCPICKKETKAQGKMFFRHCGKAWIITECLADINDLVYNTDKFDKSKLGVVPSIKPVEETKDLKVVVDE